MGAPSHLHPHTASPRALGPSQLRVAVLPDVFSGTHLHTSHSFRQLFCMAPLHMASLHMAPFLSLSGRVRPKALCSGTPPSPHEVIAGLIASRQPSTAASWPTAPKRAPAPFWLAFYVVQGPISCPANQVEMAPPPNLTSLSHVSISSHPRVAMDSFLTSISFLVDL